MLLTKLHQLHRKKHLRFAHCHIICELTFPWVLFPLQDQKKRLWRRCSATKSTKQRAFM